ncbi:uncharacterized protein TNCV_2555931 [Trichonephila clavipes]|nr:uncharacterized protein TNCV_2555931 [Trichonephila clavipes]
MDEILTTARDLELKMNEDDIEEFIMGHEDELTIEELQEILNEEHQETQRNVSSSEQEEDERGPMPISAVKDLLKKWEAVRAMVLEWHPYQADVSRVGDPYNDNAINYFRKILKKRENHRPHQMHFLHGDLQEGHTCFGRRPFIRFLSHVGRGALIWKEFRPDVRNKCQGVHSQCRSGRLIYRPSIWFTRYGDIDNLSCDRLLSRKKQ